MIRTDPAAEEDLRQYEWDKYMENLPECCVCENHIHPGQRKYRIAIGRIEATFCEDCFEELRESGEIYQKE